MPALHARGVRRQYRRPVADNGELRAPAVRVDAVLHGQRHFNAAGADYGDVQTGRSVVRRCA